MFQFGQGGGDGSSHYAAARRIHPGRFAFETGGGAARVLVIDDEPSVADALRLILEDEGFGVVVAATGRDGIEQARRGAFRLTITDLRLPDMNGLDVIGFFREQGGGGAVILITSSCTPEVCARAMELGAAGVVSKPFPPSEIIRLVAAALETD
ncbi:MAG TPA: response regulator [Pyrinomonadaceae bacterium]|jgi:DNA-binding response OmpR family regulator|nr:response regulator [Pyrinomonadaceae bacterium]